MLTNVFNISFSVIFLLNLRLPYRFIIGFQIIPIFLFLQPISFHFVHFPVMPLFPLFYIITVQPFQYFLSLLL